MANKIQFKRGLKAALPSLSPGEPGYCTDTKELYIGNASGGNIKLVKAGELITYAKDYGVLANGSSDDTQAIKNAIAATPPGGTLLLPGGQSLIYDELSITKPIKMIGSLAEDQGYTLLKFNLDGKGTDKVAIRINNQVHGCEFADFYVDHVGSETTHDGILFDGMEGSYPNFIWFSKLSGVYARNFNNNFRFKNVCILTVTNCRSISAKANGFVQTDYASALSFIGCYAQDSIADGFKFHTAFSSGCFSCYSDGNLRGFLFENCYGGYVRDCGSESCRWFAVACSNSNLTVDGLSLVESGTDQSSIFRPTAVYVESGVCEISGVSEERLISTNARLYSILFESGSTGQIRSTGRELLDFRTPYDGACAIDGQFLTQGVPAKTGWKSKDIGKVVYNQNATEQGATGSKYIIYGYRRMTTGNGNILGVDWLQLRALTGN